MNIPLPLVWLSLIGVGLIALGGFVYWLRKNYHKRSVSEVLTDRVILKIAVPRNNDKTAQAAEQLFTALHGVLLNKKVADTHFSFEIASGNYGIHFLVCVQSTYRQFVENQIYAQYPDAQITTVGDYASSWSASSSLEIVELTLSKPYGELRTYPTFDVDPIAALTASLAVSEPNLEVYFQILLRPLNNDWHEKAKVLNPDTIKVNKAGFNVILRIAVKSGKDKAANTQMSQLTAALAQFKTAQGNALVTLKKEESGWLQKLILGVRQFDKLPAWKKFQLRALPEEIAAVFSTSELASIYHFPHISVETPNIAWSQSKKLEFPLNLPTPQESRVLAETDYRGIRQKFGIKAVDRLRHMYIIGKTGVGKSTFMEQIIMADIYDGQGVGVIDPHGELIEGILHKIPKERLKDVVLFDPGDSEYPVGLNIIESDNRDDKSLIADGIVSVFKKEFANSWGPRLEYILTNAILTLLHCQNISLLVLPRLLTDSNYRKFLLKQVKDPILLKFWLEEYERVAADPRRLQEEISSILNKVGRFTTNPLVRNIIGQVSTTLSFDEIIDNRKIFLVNLAQGKIGQENMALLGGMLVTKLYSTVTRRIKKAAHERVPFYLFIDEFQNFSNSTFEKILSEARKFGLGLTIAHQFIDQIDEGVRNAVFGNVGTLVNFAVGPRDADFLVKEFTPFLSASDLINLGKHEMAIKLSIDVAQSKPFTAKSFLAPFPQTEMYSEVVEYSRSTYAKPRDVVEQKLYKWAEQVYNKNGNLIPSEKPKQQKNDENHKKDSADTQIKEEKAIQQVGATNN